MPNYFGLTNIYKDFLPKSGHAMGKNICTNATFKVKLSKANGSDS